MKLLLQNNPMYVTEHKTPRRHGGEIYIVQPFLTAMARINKHYYNSEQIIQSLKSAHQKYSERFKQSDESK